jgi:hypothetical protein
LGGAFPKNLWHVNFSVFFQYFFSVLNLFLFSNPFEKAMNATPAAYAIRSAGHPIRVFVPDRTVSVLNAMPHGEEAIEAFWQKKLAELEEEEEKVLCGGHP